MLFSKHLISAYTLTLSVANAFTAINPHRHMMTTTSLTSLNASPKTGDVVEVTYDLKPNGDFVPNPLFDDGTVSFVLNGGNYLPALHECVSNMLPGESKKMTMDAGYGEPRDDLIAKVPIASSGLDKTDLKVGVELSLANGMQCRVVEVDLDSEEETFTIDANHPLAGASYEANVKLESFENGPSAKQFGYNPESIMDSKYDVLTIALGCFWGGELEYMRVNGVVGTAVGYTQGQKDDPTYQEVCSGTTGHTEAIQVIFDPSVVSYDELVKIGLERLGESRSLVNQAGNDRGTQYRHGVYYHNFEQMTLGKSVIGSYKDCVTECMEATKFYKAEDYHQQYLLKGGQNAKKNAKEIIRCYG
jgi:peptide-methionine (S)-S-oxide reductase